MTKQIIKFIRRKDFELVKELGRGACGHTVLLHDPIIGEQFVCKKYAPMYADLTEELYQKFVQEIKLLHMINHPNVVRVFNYYLYPEEKTGYILMEYVCGSDVEDYLKNNPEDINSVFSQSIDAFASLESRDILHRDIRPLNILVSDNGEVKVIDFGFGKKIGGAKDYDKSISLNWWCEPPEDFRNDVYTHSTEIYFLGKLFEKIIIDSEIEQFSYKKILSRMILRDSKNRIRSFSDIRNEILSGEFSDLDFDPFELQAYRIFADQLTSAISKIECSTKYVEGPPEILRKLEESYKSIMLEDFVPTNPVVLRAFLSGAYYFAKSKCIRVSCVKGFLDLLRHSSAAKQNIILANLRTRMDAIERYDESSEFDDDIPF